MIENGYYSIENNWAEHAHTDEAKIQENEQFKKAMAKQAKSAKEDQDTELKKMMDEFNDEEESEGDWITVEWEFTFHSNINNYALQMEANAEGEITRLKDVTNYNN